MDTVKIVNKRNTKFIAHRGLSGIEAENTNSAFVAAANRSYFGIEGDIRKTEDGKYVIIHDNSTRRVSPTDFKVSDTDYKLLRSVILNKPDGTPGRDDLIIPNIDEFISICKTYNKTAVMELKENLNKKDIHNICNRLESKGELNRVIFISFKWDNLIFVREKYPKQPLQFLALPLQLNDELIKALKQNTTDIGLNHFTLKKEQIIKCHKNGIKVNCWTVNDPLIANRLISYGADFITTDILE